METVLVTGGAGFIGSHLCEALIKKGYKVVCVDNCATGNEDNIRHLFNGGNLNFSKIDVNKYGCLKEIFKKHRPDYVFHYAATVGVKRVIENPFNSLRDVEGIKNILDLSLRYGVKKFVFSSSSEVYGESPELPQRENGILNPLISYAAVKLVGEHFCVAYYKKHGLPTCALRFFNVYGPKQEGSDYGFVVGIFINQVLKWTRPTVFGDGTQTRDFTYISDNVKAALLAMGSEKTNGEIFNVGTGKQTTILELAKSVIEISGNRFLSPKFLPSRGEFEIKHRLPDVSKIKNLGFETEVSLEEGLEKTIGWFCERQFAKIL